MSRREDFVLVKCPRCGAEAADPVKTWSMISPPNSSGEILIQTVAMYECGKCGKDFRKMIGRERIVIKEILQKNKELEEMLVEAAKKKAELEEKIKALEEEKANLLVEVEALKAIPELETKSSALEAEVAKLREEKKGLEEKAAPAEMPAEEPAVEEAPKEEQPSTPVEEKPSEETPAPKEEQPCGPAEEEPCEEKPSEEQSITPEDKPHEHLP